MRALSSFTRSWNIFVHLRSGVMFASIRSLAHAAFQRSPSRIQPEQLDSKVLEPERAIFFTTAFQVSEALRHVKPNLIRKYNRRKIARLTLHGPPLASLSRRYEGKLVGSVQPCQNGKDLHWIMSFVIENSIIAAVARQQAQVNLAQFRSHGLRR